MKLNKRTRDNLKGYFFILPWLDTSRVRSGTFRPIFKVLFVIFLIDCALLTWCGAQLPEGLPLIRVGTLVATPLNCLLVLKDGPIQQISDLKGGKIGFSVAGVEEAVLGAMLNKHGVGLDEVEMINVNFSLGPSVMSGQADAVIGAYRNFELNQMEIEGVEGRCFYVEEEGVPTYDELIYVANPERMDRDKVRRFLRANELATQFIVNNPDESWELFKGYSPELDDELNAKAWVDTLPRFAMRPEALDEGRYVRFEKFLAESGLIEGTRTVMNRRSRLQQLRACLVVDG